MFKQAKKMLTTGLGFMLITKDKAEAMVQDWVKEGELSREEGQELLDSWSRRIDEEKEEVNSRIRTEVNRVVKSAGLPTKADFQRLEERVAVLEAETAKLRNHEDSSES